MTPAAAAPTALTVLAQLADAGARALIFAGIVGVGLVALRVKSPAVRLFAWTMVLYGALAMPVLGRVVPTWRWSVPALSGVSAWGAASADAHGFLVAESAARLRSAREPVTVGGVQSAVGRAARRLIQALPWHVIAVATYLVGLLWLAVHAGVGWMVTRRLKRSVRPICDAQALVLLWRHTTASGMTRPPRLGEAEGLFVPVTMSVIRPMIALPTDWRTWDAATLDAVLAHEVAHVARRDMLTQRLSLAYRAIFWWSPLSWWLHHRLAALAEQASDEAALRAGAAPTTYAETLLRFVARIHAGAGRAQWHVAMARAADADIERRLQRVLDWRGGSPKGLSRTVAIALTLVATPGFVFSASVLPSPPPLPIPSATLPGPVIALPIQVPVPPIARLPADRPVSRPVLQSTAASPVQSAEQPTPIQQAPGQGSYRSGDGVTNPVLVRDSPPQYTSEALQRGLEGDVELEVIVLADGTVGTVVVTRSLDNQYGLDDEAVKAARKWQFRPGRVNGQPVPVSVTLVMEFRRHRRVGPSTSSPPVNFSGTWEPTDPGKTQRLFEVGLADFPGGGIVIAQDARVLTLTVLGEADMLAAKAALSPAFLATATYNLDGSDSQVTKNTYSVSGASIKTTFTTSARWYGDRLLITTVTAASGRRALYLSMDGADLRIQTDWPNGSGAPLLFHKKVM